MLFSDNLNDQMQM